MRFLSLFFFILAFGATSCQFVPSSEAKPKWSEQEAIDVVQHELSKALSTCSVSNDFLSQRCIVDEHSILAPFAARTTSKIRLNVKRVETRRRLEKGNWSVLNKAQEHKWTVYVVVTTPQGRKAYSFHAYENTGIVENALGVR